MASHIDNGSTYTNGDGSTYGYHSELTAGIYGQHVGGFLEVARMASHIDDGSAYGYHSELTAGIMARRLLHSVLTMTAAHTGIIQERAVLTARIMAGSSAQWHGTRTAELLLISGRYY